MNLLKEASLILSDKQIAVIRFIIKQCYIPHFKNPRSLSEKINYIKLYNRNPLRELVADRLKVRNYVVQKCPSINFPTVYWHGIDFNKDIWDSLPEKFVIKANHGSNMVKIINKSKISFNEIVPVLNKWLNRDYSRYGREWFYKKLDKYIIAEEMLINENISPPDFKFFVLNGKCEFIQIDTNRFTNHKRNLYTVAFEEMDVRLVYPPWCDNIKKPKIFEKAVSTAEKLAVDFDFIRVDLYLLNNEIYFGELTNMPENGFGKFTPKSFDFDMGSKLPKKILR